MGFTIGFLAGLAAGIAITLGCIALGMWLADLDARLVLDGRPRDLDGRVVRAGRVG